MMSYNDIAGAGHMSAAEFIELSARSGVDAVDILEYYWRDKSREVRSIPGLLKDNGLALGAFCIGNNFLVPEEKRAGVIDSVKSGIDTAVMLGAQRLRIFGGSADFARELRDARIEIVAEGIGKCIDYAEANHITMVLENHGGAPQTSDEALDIVNRVNSPFLKLNFDMGNFIFYAEEDPIEAAKKTFPYVGFIHAKDLKRIEGPRKYQACIVGEGIVPVRECLQFFKQNGYEGYVSLEYEAWDTAGSMQGVSPSLEYLKKVLNEI